ncbi:type II toxin-antitoxin system prevent-host-death family antitoxin [Planosporangium thailandense]|uniref:Antitoxin n=1 Tax=Planosporangium thailandense TaxID=765197 RepID=A0ABX0XST5_9ACTN|nr:type II toxin-antitoxin system prevent-host-death family antitoxin [Planosporangium thailandense]NJC69060.1 type II toxin-antitoxin system prevent-host-death family antitoxin [Planosporangium thailandense]
MADAVGSSFAKSADGRVRATVTAGGPLRDLVVDPQLIRSRDPELLVEEIKAAVRTAMTGRVQPVGGMRRRELDDAASVTRIVVMTTLPLADAKARLSAVLDEVRDTHERVVITRNGRPEAVIMAVSDLEALEETLDLLSTPGALDQIRQAEADIAAGEGVDADELKRLLTERADRERRG